MLLNLMARVTAPALFLVLVLCPVVITSAQAAVTLTGDSRSGAVQDKRTPGSLAVPAEKENKAETREKKCMTVCSHWGEECTETNPGNGGTSKKCRRVCKQFTDECF